MWIRGEIVCDTVGCGGKFGLEEGPHIVAVQLARTHGWHCFQGPSITDKTLDLHVCPRCMERNQKALSTAAPLPGDVPLISEQGELLLQPQEREQ